MICKSNLVRSILALNLCYSASSLAVELEVPEHIQVVTLNGEKHSSSIFMWGKTLEISPGLVAVEVKYRDLLESEDDDSHQTISSAVVPLYFEVEANAKQPYQISSVRPNRVEAAYAFAKKPKFQVLYRGKEVTLLKPNYTSSMSASVSKENGQAATMLEYWWSQADDATRAAFLKKVSANH